LNVINNQRFAFKLSYDTSSCKKGEEMTSNILVIGSSNVDFIMKMERLPKLGETVTDCRFMQVFGGKGANQAVGAARAGGNVTFVSCVGDDKIADLMIENFKKDKIITDFIFKEKNVPTGAALIMIGSKGNNYISVAPGANYHLKKKQVDKVKDVIRDATIILLQYEILPETLKYIIGICHGLKKKIVLNLAPARPIEDESLEKISILVVNETEAEFLTGHKVNTQDEIEAAATSLLGKGIETVIITLGEEGSYIATGIYREKVAAFRVKAQDTTAAGDIYCGSLCVGLVESKSLQEAVKFAGAASAISVTRLGAQPSAPSRLEIEEFLKTERI
jgi:ribokinase